MKSGSNPELVLQYLETEGTHQEGQNRIPDGGATGLPLAIHPKNGLQIGTICPELMELSGDGVVGFTEFHFRTNLRIEIVSAVRGRVKVPPLKHPTYPVMNLLSIPTFRLNRSSDIART